uniref:Transmembrane protease serine 3 n=1 Tax=Lygus hesperus TaxID=30085 RepID=A0A0A9Y026_LYGHE
MHRSLIIVVLYLRILTPLMGSVRASREKRVVNGSPYADIEKSDYLSFRYFVWIGNGHNCDVPLPDNVKELINAGKDFALDLGLGWIAHKWGIICAPRPYNLKCTGSLLTPFLVQTACHCVVQFYMHKSTTGRAVPLSAAENRFSVHSAARFVDNLPDGVYSKNFVIHPQCS